MKTPIGSLVNGVVRPDIAPSVARSLVVPVTMQFTASNWNVPQRVPLTTPDDGRIYGFDVAAVQVDYYFTSADPYYSTAVVFPTQVFVADDDAGCPSENTCAHDVRLCDCVWGKGGACCEPCVGERMCRCQRVTLRGSHDSACIGMDYRRCCAGVCVCRAQAGRTQLAGRRRQPVLCRLALQVLHVIRWS